jgi:hypothetical protein
MSYGYGDCWGPNTPPTAARVDISTASNVTYQDAYQFDPVGATGCPPPTTFPCGATGPNWTLTGMNFQMDIKTSINSPSLAAQFTSSGGQINVVDAIQRIILTNVSPTALSVLVPGTYIYNLTMFDNSVPAVVTLLMYGYFTVKPGF